MYRHNKHVVMGINTLISCCIWGFVIICGNIVEYMRVYSRLRIATGVLHVALFDKFTWIVICFPENTGLNSMIHKYNV